MAEAASMEEVVQVVPRLGTVLDGVGDYATTLGAWMERAFGLRSRMVSAELFPRCASQLERALAGAPAVLLHYVNYGYDPRGCPRWLVDGLSRWRSAARGARLVTMFHEIYAFGPPWRSSFWLSPLQRRLARSVAALSSACVSNRRQSAHWLGGSRAGVHEMPVFSTLGEARDPRPWKQRDPILVVAGRSGEPGRAYDRWRGTLLAACRAVGAREIVDIGHRSRPVPSAIAHIPVRALGHVSVARASEVMAGALAGFVDYPSDFLAKSTVFAAYAAHGVVPIVSSHRGAEESGLEQGLDYWVPDHRAAPQEFEAIARRVHAWYSGHTQRVQAARYAAIIRGDA